MTSCRKTKDGQKTADNAKNIYQKTFFYSVYTIYCNDISKYLIINIDQTNTILIFDYNNNTHKIKEIKQIFVYKKEENFFYSYVIC